MTEQLLHQLSPSHRRGSNVKNSTSSSSYKGLEFSPCLQFSPSSFGTGNKGEKEKDNYGSASELFSPSIFSPSKSLLKKREQRATSPSQSKEYATSGLPAFRLGSMDNNLASVEGTSLDSPFFFSTSSSSSFRPSHPFAVESGSIFEAPSSTAFSIPIDGHGKPPKRIKVDANRQSMRCSGNQISTLFSPDTMRKPPRPGIQEAYTSRNDFRKSEYNTDSNYLGSVGPPLIIHDNYPYPLLDRNGNTISTLSKKSIRPLYTSPCPSVKPLRAQSEGEDGTGSPTQCKCKKSKCLKLYCDCFALLKFCGASCRCNECQNIEDPYFKEIRESAIKAATKRTANAFNSKVTPTTAHVAGCHCSKTNCLKKYCECFLNLATCGLNCKCQSCKNYPNSQVFTYSLYMVMHLYLQAYVNICEKCYHETFLSLNIVPYDHIPIS